MANQDDLLFPVERKSIPEHYRPYYLAKRTNFFAGLQGSPNLWRYYQLLDKILFDEFQDMSTPGDLNRMFPLALFFNAHAKIRISLELAFTRCMEEARSILRDAIETAVYAHYMHDDPKLQKIWLSKDDTPEAAKEFKEAFEKDKKIRSFRDVPELYKRWGELCETGAHSTPQAIMTRFKIKETDENIHYQLNYTGVEDRDWETETFTFLLTVSLIEKLVFSDYETRFQLDENLVRNRSMAEALREKLRQYVIKKYDIQPPQAKPANRL
jgi:tetratricopeptide (TPR) repeat protein